MATDGPTALNRAVLGQAWAVRMPKSVARAAAQLRSMAGVEACLTSEHLWIRGAGKGEALEKTLRMLPGAERFEVAAEGQLQPVGTRVPHGRLPDGPWAALAECLGIELPVAGLAGRISRRTPLVLVRSCQAEEAKVLITAFETWEEYAVTAPQVRLDRWQFAVAADKRALVRGQPLPPLPGQRWLEREGIAVPAGWKWSPPVEPAVVRCLLGLEGHDLALLHPDGTWEKIPAAGLERVCRSAVRRTAEGMRHD